MAHDAHRNASKQLRNRARLMMTLRNYYRDITSKVWLFFGGVTYNLENLEYPRECFEVAHIDKEGRGGGGGDHPVYGNLR